MNYSKHREMILAYLKSVKTHPTAETVYENIKSKCSTISLATVYRNLNQLSDLNIIKRIKVDGSADRFDGNAMPHNHLYCRCCGKIDDIPLELGEEKLYRFIKTNFKFSVEGCDVIFYGVCGDCENLK